MSKNSRRITHHETHLIKLKLDEIAEKKKIPEKFWELAGSYRRRKSHCGDLDLCIRQRDFGKWASELVHLAEKGSGVLIKQKDGTLTAVMYKETRIELYIAEDDNSFGSMLMFCTGSWEWNVMQRNKAIKLGMKLNEKGIFIPRVQGFIAGKDKVRFGFNDKVYKTYGEVETKDGKWWKIAGKTEEECYKVLEMDFVEPDKREI